MSGRSRSVGVALVLAGATVSMGVPGSATATDITHEVVMSDDNAFLRHDFAEVGARPNASFGSDVDQPDGWHGNVEGEEVSGLGFVSDRDSDGWESGALDGDFFFPGAPYEGWSIQVGTALARWNHDGATRIRGSWTGSGTSPGARVTWAATSPINGVTVELSYRLPSNGDVAIITEATLTNTTDSELDVVYARAVDPDNCSTKILVCDSDGDGVADASGEFATLQTIESQRHRHAGISAVTASQTDGSALTLWTAEADSVAFAGAGEDEIWCISPPDLNEILDLATTYSAEAPAFLQGNCNRVVDEGDPDDGYFMNRPGAVHFADDLIGVAARRSIAPGESVTIAIIYGFYTVDVELPANISAPTISGSVVTGATLTAEVGEWANAPTSYEYQWLACNVDGENCEEILGATSATYVVSPDDIGHEFMVSVLASNEAGSATSPAVSAPTASTVPELPATGSPGTPTPILLGLILLGVGALLVTVRRGRVRAS